MYQPGQLVAQSVALRAVILAVLLFLQGKLIAQELPASSQRVLVPESLKLSRLVDLTSQATGREYSYNPADLDHHQGRDDAAA